MPAFLANSPTFSSGTSQVLALVGVFVESGLAQTRFFDTIAVDSHCKAKSNMYLIGVSEKSGLARSN